MYVCARILARAASRGKKNWGYLVMSALLIFSLLYLVFLLIYLSGIYSLASSHKPLGFCFSLQSSHKKMKIYTVFRLRILCPFEYCVNNNIHDSNMSMLLIHLFVRDIPCLINLILFWYDCRHCSVLLVQWNYLEVNSESCLRAKRH